MIRLRSLAPALILICLSCHDNDPVADDPNFAIPDWTKATHGNGVDPDYETVFPQEQVNTLQIDMTNVEWRSIQIGMRSLYGVDFGAGGNQGAFPIGDPPYVAASVKFNGKEWYKVGFRLKGNSSLSASWRAGIYKLPFRLHFDKFEDQFTQIKNQRFFGFKELSLSPGFQDNSLIREKAGSDIFNMAGIASSQTAFYKVFINFGDGVKYCGVYTLVEVVDDTMIKDRFGDDDGNIYKPESDFTSFVASQFEKKNNEEDNNFSDVQTTIATLHSSLRTSNPSQWRTQLEEKFDVDHFLKWLAVNTVMLNWDSYGRMPHNYYLFNHPEKKLTWIPWDNNECMFNRGNEPVTISLSHVTANWPLIRYVMDDAEYKARYKEHVEQFVTNVFTTAKMNALFDKYHALISPYVAGPQETEQDRYTHLPNSIAFTNSVPLLKAHVATQREAAIQFLGQ